MGLKFKNKITLHCFREVKCKQGFTTGTFYYLYNSLGVNIYMCISGVMVSESEFKYGHLESFPGKVGYKLSFQFF